MNSVYIKIKYRKNLFDVFFLHFCILYIFYFILYIFKKIFNIRIILVSSCKFFVLKLKRVVCNQLRLLNEHIRILYNLFMNLISNL